MPPRCQQCRKITIIVQYICQHSSAAVVWGQEFVQASVIIVAISIWQLLFDEPPTPWGHGCGSGALRSSPSCRGQFGPCMYIYIHTCIHTYISMYVCACCISVSLEKRMPRSCNMTRNSSLPAVYRRSPYMCRSIIYLLALLQLLSPRY